jgi:hypothetical protein
MPSFPLEGCSWDSFRKEGDKGGVTCLQVKLPLAVFGYGRRPILLTRCFQKERTDGNDIIIDDLPFACIDVDGIVNL